MDEMKRKMRSRPRIKNAVSLEEYIQYLHFDLINLTVVQFNQVSLLKIKLISSFCMFLYHFNIISQSFSTTEYANVYNYQITSYQVLKLPIDLYKCV